MERRLRLARRLLDPGGSVLIVTIDEKEVHRLGLLLEDVFPDCTRQMVTIVINPNGVARKSEMSRVEEYAFIVFLGSAGPHRINTSMLGEDELDKQSVKVRWEWLLRGGTNSRREDRPNLFYPIYVDPTLRSVAKVGDPIPLKVDRAEIPNEAGLITVWPMKTNGEEGNWRASSSYLRELLSTGQAKVGAYDRTNDRWSILYLGKAQIRRIESGEINVIGRDPTGALILDAEAHTKSLIPKTVWHCPGHRTGEWGSVLLKRLLPGRSFPFPKSLYTVEDTLRVAVGDHPNAIILDFLPDRGPPLTP